MSLLESIAGPADLKRLNEQQLIELCEEIRQSIIETVARTGGHLGSSLGVVELAVILHRVLNSPTDKIVWDTGHQAYAHKLLTGRLERFGTLRQLGGVGGFPRRSESEHDVFDGGHAGTGLSIAEGLALARDERGTNERIAVVVGDAALMTGLSLEALNDIGHRKTRMLIVLNDNEMSISPTVGAFSTYLSRIKLSRTWHGTRRTYDESVARIPLVGATVLEWSQRFRKSVVSLAQPGQLFEDLGIVYAGPVPGHDLRALELTFRRALRTIDGPIIVHVRTQKGRGYRPAERDKVSFHGAALPPMQVMDAGDGDTMGSAENDVSAPSVLAPAASLQMPVLVAGGLPSNGNGMTGPGQAEGDASLPALQRSVEGRKGATYTAVLAEELIRIAEGDDRVVAITAGMPTGTGLNRFQAAFPGRMFDVGIAEQHAVTLATGLALGGRRPFVAIYSTFLQRAFDQTVHDVCQNDVPVVLGVDRAGLVGEDGTSHQGMFTLAAQRQLPNLIIAAPKDEQELRQLIRTAFSQDHPFALHYPRDPGLDLPPVDPAPLPIGRGEVLREGSDIVIAGFGPIVQRGLEVADRLAAEGWSVEVVNARFLKPLDRDLLLAAARDKRLVVTLEESVVAGGFGSAVLETLAEAGLADPPLRAVPVKRIGIPADRFVDHGSVGDLRRIIRLDAEGILEQIRETIAELGLARPIDDGPPIPRVEARPA